MNFISSKGTKKERICVVCGSEITRIGHTTFCSNECRNIDLNSKRKTRTCHVCGKELTAAGYHKFCSKECESEYRKSLKKVKYCLVCGTQVFGRYKVCSDECRAINNKATAKIRRKKYRKQPLMITAKCAECGNEFTKKRPNTLYCSSTCRNKALLRKRHAKKGTLPRSERIKIPGMLNKKRLPSEKVKVDNMMILNTVDRSDKERLRLKGIISHDVSTCEFRYFDPVMKITRFFKTRERYEKFIQSINQ